MSFSGFSSELPHFVDALPGCFVVLAADLSIGAASREWLDWVGVKSDGVLGRSVTAVYQQAGLGAGNDFIDVVGRLTGDVFETGKGNQVNVGGVRILNVPVMGDARVGWVIQRVTRGENENQVAELMERLAQIQDELKGLSYSVSHDFRAPLRAIDGWSLALLEDYGAGLDETGRGYLKVVREECGRMSQMIDDVVRLSRVSGGKVRAEEVDLSQLAQVVAEKVKGRYPGREVELKVAGGLTVVGDLVLLERLLEALLDNAWKFTGKKAKANVELGAQDEGGERVYWVKDDGVGFDMDYAERLFSPFQKMHGAAEYAGSGVGLALARRIVRMHMGRIWAQARPGQGTSIYFTLGKVS